MQYHLKMDDTLTEEEKKKITERLEQKKDIIAELISDCQDFPYFNDTLKQLIKNSAFEPEVKRWFILGNGNIKCDAKNCDWNKKGFGLENLYLWQDVPCPKCGANVLTKEDWYATKVLNVIMGFPLMRFANWFGSKLGLKKKYFRTKMNGTGKVEFEELKKEDFESLQNKT